MLKTIGSLILNINDLMHSQVNLKVYELLAGIDNVTTSNKIGENLTNEEIFVNV